MRRSSRGFSLLEMTIASGISATVLALGLAASVQLHRRSTLEEQTAGSQNTLRALSQVVVPELERAGAGIGGGRVYFGSTTHYAIEVHTKAAPSVFSGTGYYAPTGADAGTTTYGTPSTADYGSSNQYDSDEFEVATGEVKSMVVVTSCLTGSVRVGSQVCVGSSTVAATLANKPVLVTNPRMRQSCVMNVTSVATSGGETKLTLNSTFQSGDNPSSQTLCATDYASNSTDTTVKTFWDQTDTVIMPITTRAFRVNWSTGSPVLEMDPDGTHQPGQGWMPISRYVDRIQVRMGVSDLTNPYSMPDSTHPGERLMWFPEADASGNPVRPGIDGCVQAGANVGMYGCAIPGATSLDPAKDETSVYDALMRRVRGIELVVTSRSPKADLDHVQRVLTTGTFAFDGEKNYLDGFKHRTMVVRVTPRNFALLKN